MSEVATSSWPSRIIVDYGEDTPEEKALRRQVLALQEAYFKAAQPLMDRLTQIHMAKTPRMMFFADDAGAGP
jgi:hypothetical protein